MTKANSVYGLVQLNLNQNEKITETNIIDVSVIFFADGFICRQISQCLLWISRVILILECLSILATK